MVSARLTIQLRPWSKTKINSWKSTRTSSPGMALTAGPPFVVAVAVAVCQISDRVDRGSL